VIQSEESSGRAGVAGRGRVADTADEAVWREFAEASSAPGFYRSWLTLQCRSIGGVSSAVIVAGPPNTGPFAPVAFWPDGRRNVQHLAEVVARVLAERRGRMLKREIAPGPNAFASHRYDVAYPIQVGGKLYGVVALDVSPRPEAELQAVLYQLQWGSGWLEALVRRQEASAPAETGERLKTVLDLSASALGHERFHAAATSFATALATRLDCDRVSIGFLRRGHTRVRAVSHSAQFGKQTNLVRAIEAAMDEAVDQGGIVIHPPPAGGDLRVTRAHQELASQQGDGAICTVLLTEGTRVVGAVTLERPTDRPFDLSTGEFCEALAAVVGPVLELRRRDDRWIGAKVLDAGWGLLGRLVGPHHLASKLVTAALVATIVFLARAEGDYRVSARTVMEAAVRRAAVAPFSGYIKAAPVRAGDVVRQGQTLCMLEDRDLRLERLKWESQEAQFAQQRNQALAARNAAQIGVANAQIAQARAQIALLDEQLRRTRVVADFDGVVVTGDLSQSLGSPVERGEVLFEVAPLDAYRVVLQVDERDIADVKVGQRGQILLAATPADPIPFTVEKITPVSTAREGRNYFRVEARLASTPERLRPGLEGVGKIEVDRRLLVWVWTRQAVDWVRLALWTWLP
jgi:RND family efflux transporter MFP subunit